MNATVFAANIAVVVRVQRLSLQSYSSIDRVVLLLQTVYCIMPSQRTVDEPYAYMQGRHQQAKYSLQCRGKHVEDMNKIELLDMLYDDIVLEKKVRHCAYVVSKCNTYIVQCRSSKAGSVLQIWLG